MNLLSRLERRLPWPVLSLSLALTAAAPDRGAGNGPGAAQSPKLSASTDWATAVKDWVPVKPGEHPRLVFRKGDLPALKKRAETPEGKAILQRLDQQLADKFSLWHAAGYAFLYQLRGDKQHAVKAREMIEKIFAGEKDKDGRYGFSNPGSGGKMRSGPATGAVGLAYDLAYDAWDDAFRQKVAAAIQDNKWTADIVNAPPICPGCNHWGAAVGGVGIGLLAIRGDAGIDAKKIDEWLDKIAFHARRELVEGYGDHGYYGEGHYCGRISSNSGLIPFLQCYRIAAGKDLVKNCSNAQWLAAKWIYDFTYFDGKTRSLQRGMYARDPFTRGDMLSSDGDFAQGFGIVPEEVKPAFLWTFNHMVQPGDAKDYDVLHYPHMGVFAFVNWPIGMKEKNPEEILPRVMADKTIGYYVFRNGWKGTADDLVVTALLGSAGSMGRGMGKGGTVMILGGGMRVHAPGMFYFSKTTHFQSEKDGSGVLSAVMLDDSEKSIIHGGNDNKLYQQAVGLGKGPNCLAVDFSGKSGAALLVVQVGPHVGYQTALWTEIVPAKVQDQNHAGGYSTKTTQLQLGGQKAYVVTLQKGAAPEPKAEGGKVVVGGQSVSFDGSKLAIGR
jgi:hypothetical protein